MESRRREHLDVYFISKEEVEGHNLHTNESFSKRPPSGAAIHSLLTNLPIAALCSLALVLIWLILVVGPAVL